MSITVDAVLDLLNGRNNVLAGANKPGYQAMERDEFESALNLLNTDDRTARIAQINQDFVDMMKERSITGEKSPVR